MTCHDLPKRFERHTVCLEVYAFNVRMHLVENSLDSPATGHAPEDSKCATPARTFLNTDSCGRLV